MSFWPNYPPQADRLDHLDLFAFNLIAFFPCLVTIYFSGCCCLCMDKGKEVSQRERRMSDGWCRWDGMRSERRWAKKERRKWQVVSRRSALDLHSASISITFPPSSLLLCPLSSLSSCIGSLSGKFTKGGYLNAAGNWKLFPWDYLQGWKGEMFSCFLVSLRPQLKSNETKPFFSFAKLNLIHFCVIFPAVEMNDFLSCWWC